MLGINHQVIYCDSFKCKHCDKDTYIAEGSRRSITYGVCNRDKINIKNGVCSDKKEV